MRISTLAAAVGAVIAISFAAGTAGAQAGSRSPSADSAAAGWSGELPKHFEGITLTDAQKSEIVALQKKYHARMDALRDSARAAGAAVERNEALTAQLRAVMNEEHAAFRALLDEQGRRRFDANMAHMHHGAGHGTSHGAGHGAGHRPPPLR